ncbi:metabotropic glutamate receptor 6-like isoform X2 [Mercenaria mercenaria]|uniref:metabotropic glutamate receptor 6-like isoform X2 n=1 Tax=Mercenaria mercenaria TaxID=6596 RepID=UPI00234EAAD5|nr:metabotropic glutamate receptor 6-like isoform X2 [Mercenaria mercenaria]
MEGRVNFRSTLTFIVYFKMFIFPVYTSAETVFVNETGDFIVGGMFPVTKKGQCGKAINDQTGIQNLEALLYSRQKANEQILKDINLTLGVMAFDTCDTDTVALDRALDFVKFQKFILQHTDDFHCKSGTAQQVKSDRGQLLGVIGGATSSVSIQLASFLRLFKIPQISYSATSPELDDTSRYDYFLRTAASDKHQARAIVEILKKFDWKYVIGIFEDTSYGIEGFNEISRRAEEADICIGNSYKIDRYLKRESDYLAELERIVNDTLKYKNTNEKIVAILYVSEEVARDIFNITRDLNIADQFIWIGSDAWTGRNLDIKAANTLGVQPKIVKIKDFDDYFKNLNSSHNKTNPWFDEYLEFHCRKQNTSRNAKEKVCKGMGYVSKDDAYRKNNNTYAVMDAVFAFAHALKSLHKAKCQGKGMCTDLVLTKTEELMPYLKKVNFTGLANLSFHFDGNSGPARYSVMQYTTNGWEEVAKCQVENDTALGEVSWFDEMNKTKAEPGYIYLSSKCSSPCKQGEAKQLHANKCCWTCKPCQRHQYLEDRNNSCIDCPEGQWATASQTGCEQLPEIRLDIGWAISAYIFTCIGVIVTSLVAGIFYWQRQTPLIMASGKELSFVLLLGILMSYLSSFTFVAYPSPVSCGATRVMLGLSYTVVYAAILVKTNRIYRVFNINTSKPKKVRFIDAKSQLLITLVIVSVEIVAMVTWLIFDPAKETFDYPTRTEKIPLCEDAKDFAYLGALAYPFILMVLCVYYAIRTRKTPDGFNETRYITFGSYSFCVLWIAFTSIYFSVHDNTIRVVSLCFASSINATVTLITLFITKTYVVIFRPQKNTRENVMSRRRTHTYDTVNINNLSNLSRMASAVSTWHSVNTRFDSDDSQQPTITINQKPKFTNHLSVSVVSMNNIDQTEDARCSNLSSYSAPPDHRQLTEEEVRALSAPFKQSSTDLGDERLKQFLEKHEKADDKFGVQLGVGQMVPRRSLRSFKSRRKRRRTVKRSRSLDGGNELNVPGIVVTRSSQEDNSVTVVKP